MLLLLRVLHLMLLLLLLLRVLHLMLLLLLLLLVLLLRRIRRVVALVVRQSQWGCASVLEAAPRPLLRRCGVSSSRAESLEFVPGGVVVGTEIAARSIVQTQGAAAHAQSISSGGRAVCSGARRREQVVWAGGAGSGARRDHALRHAERVLGHLVHDLLELRVRLRACLSRLAGLGARAGREHGPRGELRAAQAGVVDRARCAGRRPVRAAAQVAGERERGQVQVAAVALQILAQPGAAAELVLVLQLRELDERHHGLLSRLAGLRRVRELGSVRSVARRRGSVLSELGPKLCCVGPQFGLRGAGELSVALRGTRGQASVGVAGWSPLPARLAGVEVGPDLGMRPQQPTAKPALPLSSVFLAQHVVVSGPRSVERTVVRKPRRVGRAAFAR